MPDVGTELMSVPFPEMVQRLGVGIAEAQLQLDLVSMRIARMMAGYPDPDAEEDLSSSLDGQGRDEGLLVPFGKDKSGELKRYSLLELGFTPTFYQFVDTVIELKMSISTKSETESKRSSSHTRVSAKAKLGFFSGSASVDVSSVNASFSAKYQYSAEGSSVMRTKLVPVPAPTILEQRIRELLDADTEAP